MIQTADSEIMRDTADQRTGSELVNSASLDAFNSDLDGLFDLSIADMDLFGWSGDLWTNNT
jgi:hypothetical protein